MGFKSVSVKPSTKFLLESLQIYLNSQKHRLTNKEQKTLDANFCSIDETINTLITVYLDSIPEADKIIYFIEQQRIKTPRLARVCYH